VKVEKPINVLYNSESKDGRRVFTFPDCVTMKAFVTLPPGTEGDRIAVQFDVNILPAGKLKCIDPGACNKECYYCNFCNNTKKLDVMSNSNGQQACNLVGGKRVEVSATACPPPESFNKAQCEGFTKSDPTYWQKKGDVQTRLLIWERSPEEAALKQKYYTSVAKNGILKAALKAQYTIDNKAFISQNLNPTNEDYYLSEFYCKKNAKVKEALIACVEGTTNYSALKGGKAMSFLLEAGSLAAQPKSLFDTKQCPEVDKINQAQAQSEAAAAQANAPKGSNPFSQFFG
jgi:hypothetical protein